MFCESVFCNRSVSSKQQLSKLDARWLFLREHIHKIKVHPHPPSYPTDKLCFAQEVPWHKGNIKKKNHISYEHLHNSPFFSMQGWPCKIENPDTAQRGCSKLKLCTGNWTVRRMEREKELLCNIVDCYAEGLLVQMSHLMAVILHDILYVKKKDTMQTLIAAIHCRDALVYSCLHSWYPVVGTGIFLQFCSPVKN